MPATRLLGQGSILVPPAEQGPHLGSPDPLGPEAHACSPQPLFLQKPQRWGLPGLAQPWPPPGDKSRIPPSMGCREDIKAEPSPPLLGPGKGLYSEP